MNNLSLEKHSILEVSNSEFSKAFLKLRKDRQSVIVRGFEKLLNFPAYNLTEIENLIGKTPVNIAQRYAPLYFHNLRRYQSGEKRIRLERKQATFKEFIDLIQKDEGTQFLMNETILPQELQDLIDLAPLGLERFANPQDNSYDPKIAWSFMFCANKGNFSDLHTDWDGRDVVLYQIFGKKRVILFPPESAIRLAPSMIFSSLNISAMSGFELEELLAYAHGQIAILEPGDAVFMPAFYWHHFEYLELAMSISFRIDGIGVPDQRELITRLHQDHFTQQIHVRLIQEKNLEKKKHCISMLLFSLNQNYSSSMQKYNAMQVVCRKVLQILDPNYEKKVWVFQEDFLKPSFSAVYSLFDPRSTTLQPEKWIEGEKIREESMRKALQSIDTL